MGADLKSIMKKLKLHGKSQLSNKFSKSPAKLDFRKE